MYKANRTACKQKQKYPTVDDTENFVDIYILSGCHFLTSKMDFCNKHPDLEVPFVSESISCDSFLKIKKFFT